MCCEKQTSSSRASQEVEDAHKERSLRTYSEKSKGNKETHCYVTTKLQKVTVRDRAIHTYSAMSSSEEMTLYGSVCLSIDPH